MPRAPTPEPSVGFEAMSADPRETTGAGGAPGRPRRPPLHLDRRPASDADPGNLFAGAGGIHFVPLELDRWQADFGAASFGAGIDEIVERLGGSRVELEVAADG